MDIKSIDIPFCQAGYGKCGYDLKTEKTLPWLSVAQSLVGTYSIALNEDAAQNTVEMGAFIAPSLSKQQIVHNPPKNRAMQMQWCFIEIIINDIFAIDDLFDFSTIIGYQDGMILADILQSMNNSKDSPFLSSLEKIISQKKDALRLLEFLLRFAKNKPDGTSDHSILRAINYIKRNYYKNISTDELSQITNMSKTMFFDRFKNATKTTPIKMITDLRLKHTAKLLLNTNKTVQEIAFECGYDDSLYFSKLFKKHFGASPISYRKNKQLSLNL